MTQLSLLVRGIGLVASIAGWPPATAQGEQGARREVLGTVKDRAGRPWAGAAVVVLSRLHPPGLDFEDRLETRSDECGRFRVSLLRERVYAAWAYEAASATRWRVTDLCDGITGARPILLQEDPWTRVRARLRLDEVAGWAGTSELRLVCRASEIYPEGPHAAIDLAPVSGAAIELPALPHRGLSVWLEAGGRPRLHLAALHLISEHWGLQREATLADDGTARIVVPARRWLLVRVTDAEGRPVADARVHAQHGPWRLERDGRPPALAVTDATGLTLIAVPMETEPHGDSLVAEASAGVARWHGDLSAAFADRDGAKLLASQQPDATIQLAPAKALLGRLLLASGHPAAGTELRLTLFKWGIVATLATDAEGRFVVPWVDANELVGLEARLSPEQRRQVETAAGVPVWPTAVLAHFEAPRDLGDVVLAGMPRLALRVRGHDGRAAAGALVQISGMPGRSMATDARGALDVILRPLGDAWVCVHGPGGFAAEHFAMADRRVTMLELTATAAAEISGRVLDARGAPVADAWVFLNVFSGAGWPAEVQAFGNLLHRQTLSDAEGRFRLPAVRSQTTYTLSVGTYVGSDWLWGPRTPVEVGAGTVAGLQIDFDAPAAGGGRR